MNQNKTMFIKTHNSPVFLYDYAKALKEENISYRCGDTGLYVTQKDYERALEILAELESELKN